MHYDFDEVHNRIPRKIPAGKRVVYKQHFARNARNGEGKQGGHRLRQLADNRRRGDFYRADGQASRRFRGER